MRRDISATSNDWRATQTGAVRERGEEEDVGVRVADANVLSCDVEAQGYVRVPYGLFLFLYFVVLLPGISRSVHVARPRL